MQSMQIQYEKCPKHPQNDIVLFCVAECKEVLSQIQQPLCKECCKLHVAWHNQNRTVADIDTIDNVRQVLLAKVVEQKIRFEEERAILHHFSDGEHSTLIKNVHAKLEKVKQSLIKVVNDYCTQLEESIKQRLISHRAAHPGEKKELHHKLNAVIQDLDNQEKSILGPKYIRGCLTAMTQEQNHNLDHFQNEIDSALKHYLSNMFDVFIHEDKLKNIISSIHEYVEVHEANLKEELDIYTKKLREGKRVYGVDQQTQNLALSQNKQSIFDYGAGQQSRLQQSNTIFKQAVQQNTFVPWNPQTKNYESRIMSNNEKLRQYYA